MVFFFILGVVNDTFIDISVSRPGLREVKVEEGHIELECFSGTIVVPEFQATFDVLSGSWPVTLDITLEGLTENRVELLNVLL